MNELVGLDLLVDKSVADEISRKGLAEIALRRSDAKFRAMIKCKVLGNPTTAEGIPQKLIENALQVGIPDQIDIESIRGSFHLLNKEKTNICEQISLLSAKTKSIAIQADGIYQNTNIIKNISYVNTGLVLANMVVSVAGYAMVGQKLSALNEKVSAIDLNVNHIANVQKNDKISECQIIIMRCNALLAKIEENDEISLDDMENLLIDMCGFITKMVRNLHEAAMEIDILLEMIYTLLPAYTVILNEFVKNYYFKKKKLPANYNSYMKVFELLTNTAFREAKEDYYFLTCKLNGVKVLDILTAQDLIVLNGAVSIDDQLKLMGFLGTEKEYFKFEESLDELVAQRISALIPELANSSEIDVEKCAGYLL